MRAVDDNITPDGRELFSNLRKAKEERQRKQEEMEL